MSLKLTFGLTAAAGVRAISLAFVDRPREDSTGSLARMLIEGGIAKECKKKEVVVVGGGVCGLSTAWEGFQ